MDDDLLVRRAQEGDDRAARQLFDVYQLRTFRLALGLLGDSSDAEEVAQDALTYALLNIHNYNADLSSFSTWLHTITVSRSRDKRRRKILPSIPLAHWLGLGHQIRDHTPGPESYYLRQEAESGLLSALDQLSPKLREAIVLRFYADCTYKEMGDIMGCSLNTARSRLRLAIDKLRAQLGEEQVRWLAAENIR
ncbi:MAG TPA: sigma-70 family RNA polymerase sigma factor [Aggregatilinea sp.]|jgi:RNA polymerase sigma-70 factor (ECF subfamily)|uniref:RNA polymerase sigma factor n=1 Tax=Aggregatilinea sp. TaxID=2806333 RepID=UPI002C6AD8FE|nr:sigma-70 family RNA polymerase sigma factor [Aggregatilinea sp.]HML20461.1 sigma-70 family RNA polymerase sigma factor [Aggregatilinea sp.]